MRLFPKRFLIPVATAAALLFTATSASAVDVTRDASTEGATATCRVFTSKTNTANDTANVSCTIRDTLDDRRSVYVDWWIYSRDKRRLSNTSGAGTSVLRYDKDTGPSTVTVYWAVCRLNNFGDNCSERVRVNA